MPHWTPVIGVIRMVMIRVIAIKMKTAVTIGRTIVRTWTGPCHYGCISVNIHIRVPVDIGITVNIPGLSGRVAITTLAIPAFGL